MPRAFRSLCAGLAVLAFAGGLAGCKDAPTSPRALRLLADGQGWAAISAPETLPDAATWLPYLAPAAGPRGAGAQRVLGLQREARRLRDRGQVARAEELRREADRVALRSLDSVPDAAVLVSAMGALDQWMERVRTHLPVDDTPQVAAALARVRSHRTGAAEALARGDTMRAVSLVGEAAEQIRDWSPTAIALRVLARAEERLANQAPSTPAVARARHLVSRARLELAHGDPVHALRQAVYALQLADGQGVGKPPSTEGDAGAG